MLDKNTRYANIKAKIRQTLIAKANMKSFAQTLSSWMTYSGKTQSDIATELGVSRQQVHQHISGETKHPTLRTVERYADLFGVSVPEFLSDPPRR